MYIGQPQRVFHAHTACGPATLHAHHLGPHPIIEYYLKRIDLRGIVGDCLGLGTRRGHSDSRVSHAEVIATLVHNFIVSPVPLYRVGQWLSTVDAAALGLTEPQKNAFNDDRIARTLEALSHEDARSLFFRVALRVIKDFSIRTERIHFDTTSVTFSGAYHSTGQCTPRICRGHNKDGRPDLKQLVFGLNVSADGAVPLLHHVWSGNRNDSTTHQPNVMALRRLLTREDFIYVADCKLCSSANLATIAAGGGHFVTILPRRRKEDTAFRQYLREADKPPMWRLLLKLPSGRGPWKNDDTLCTCKTPFDTTEEGYRLIWVRSAQKARVDQLTRHQALRASLDDLQQLSTKLNRGKLRTRTAIRSAVTAVLRRHGVRGRGFLTVGIELVAGAHSGKRRSARNQKRKSHKRAVLTSYRLTITINRQTIKRDARTDGVYPLITNLPSSYGKRQIVEIYKYQPYIEKRFAALKSELSVAPLYLKKTSRVAGMLHVYFFAVVVASLIERTVRANMESSNIKQLPLLPEDRKSSTPTYPRILEAFAHVCWHRYEQPKSEPVVFPLQLDERQQQLLQLLEVPQEAYRM